MFLENTVNHKEQFGWIEVICGSMFSGKTEELIRSHPVDGAVLMGGCDKTTPGLVMGALSAGLPFIYLPAGPMLRGNWKGQILGSGSDAWKYWDERRAGKISDVQWLGIEGGIARSHGGILHVDDGFI